MSIDNFKDLKDHIYNIVDNLDKNNLISIDIYLRSMLGILYDYSDQTPSYSVFAQILEKSFDAEPIEFDESWLELTKPPFLHCQPNPDDFDNSMIDLDTNEIVPKFEIALKTLIFEIAEFKRCSEISKTEESTIENQNSNTNYHNKNNIYASNYNNDDNIYAPNYKHSEIKTSDEDLNFEDKDSDFEEEGLNFEDEDSDFEEEYQLGWNSPDIVYYLLAMAEHIDYSQEEICDWLTITDTLEYGRLCNFLDDET